MFQIFNRKVICPIKGHDLESFLTENDGYISNKRCKRCYSIPISEDSFTYKIKHIPPPNSSDSEIESWEKYCEDKYTTIRNGL